MAKRGCSEGGKWCQDSIITECYYDTPGYIVFIYLFCFNAGYLK